MDTTYSVSVKLIQGILAAADQIALPATSLLRAIGLPVTAINNADNRLAHSQFVALWREISRRAQAPAVGLRLAELTTLETFNVTGYAMSHSPTLGTALRRLIRYGRLLYEGMSFGLIVGPETTALSYGVVNAALPLPVASIEWSLANIVLWAARSMGCSLPLTKVTWQQPAPADCSVYRQFFQSELRFEDDLNSLVFPTTWLDQPLVNADPGLCDLLDRYADSLLLALPKSETFLTQLQHLMAQELRGREPKLDAIAAQLGYSPRTLQRKLQQANTSFQQLLDDIRKELALQYLKDTSLTTSEIAFLLGFSENSAFNRAFRRWTTLTPGEYRKQSDIFARSSLTQR
ncbi:MAG: AraC family transcriptional regulator [Cyanobacteria bacterium P01_H01_bin.21]